MSDNKYNKEAFIKEMKRRRLPEGYRLEASPIIIEVGDREYGIVCECECKEFSEDNMFGKLVCFECGKQIAVRGVETSWVEDEEV